jgi:hypothetical protein
MASQFTVYASTDSGAIAGSITLNGNAGSLITVLDACLVNGYTGKAAAGWTKPVATASNITSYKQGAGALLGLVINDATPNGTSLGKEAWATGWESVAGVGSPVGSGTNQFPTAAQLLTSGHVVIRKSNATGTGAIAWIVVADSSTFYLFTFTTDVASVYYMFAFGDIYSHKNTTDTYRAIIMGRNLENDTSVAAEGFDLFSAFNAAVVGNYMARTYAGTGTSLQVGKHGDSVKGSATSYLGTGQYTNGPDASMYISPIWVCESAGPLIRGRLRGLYMPLHAISNFTDGQTFSGSGDYAGKTFLAIKQSRNSGVILIDTSATVETN